MLCIMAGMDQKDSLLAVACARLVLLVFHTSCCVPWCRFQALIPCIMDGMDQENSLVGCAGDDTARAVFLLCLHAQDARHSGWYGPEGQ